MEFDLSTLSNANNLIAYIVVIAVFVFLDVVFFVWFSKKVPLILLLLSEILIVVAYPLGLNLLTYVGLAIFAGFLALAFYVNSHDIHFLYHNFQSRFTKSVGSKANKKEPEALFDREAMYAKIKKAVEYFSKSKTGALMTFQRNDPLSEYIDTGVRIDAPVSAELLETIFYEGTFLHDGAVIIKDDMIVAAACMFQPSTKPMTGKMGLRHRAAIGVSETSDAVTVVCSEETGRVSIAYGGDLEPVTLDEFATVFSEYMALGFEHHS